MPNYRHTATVPDMELPPEDEGVQASTPCAAGDTFHDDKDLNKRPDTDPGEKHDEAKTKKKSHHHGDGHGEHEGHGGKWLVTYCDMVTLLMAFFICILTFSSKENGNKAHARLRDSIIYGTGGTGAIGDQSANADSIVWRQVLSSVSLESKGASQAPLYSDPQLSANEQVLDLLDKSTQTILDDDFSIRVPLVVLMNEDKTVSPAGRRLLGNLAFALKQFPYDLILQIENRDAFPSAFRLSKHVSNLAGCPPSRTGISLVEHGTGQRDSVRFKFVARK